MARSFDFKILLSLLQPSSQSGFSQDRRAFIKTATATSAASLLFPGCGTFDRWVLGDSNHLDEEVMILGAGLAGLAAAYHLKKNKIPFRVFEASDRIGGRVQTLFQVNADNQFIELGAEFFDSSHKTAWQLCKDLNLTAQDISFDLKKDRGLYWLNGKVVDEKEFRKNLKPLALRLSQVRRDFFSVLGSEMSPQALLRHPQMAQLDQQSLGEFLYALRDKMDSATLDCFERLCVSEWGLDSKNINLLHFLVRLDLEEKKSANPPPKIYRVEGGMSRMVQVLGERVQGVVPESHLKLQHKIVAIRERAGGYECTFKMPRGSDTVWAKQVICALPWSILQDIDGIQNLELGLKKDIVVHANYGTHSKVVSGFKSPVWRSKSKGTLAFQGVLRGQLTGQSYWDSARGQEGVSGLLTSQRGGAVGHSTGASAAQESLQDLRLFFKDAPPEDFSHICNWSQKPFAKGSRFNLLPGTYLKYLEALIEENGKEKFYLAGEQMSFRDGGTMNGALESGIAAAERALRSIFKTKTI